MEIEWFTDRQIPDLLTVVPGERVSGQGPAQIQRRLVETFAVQSPVPPESFSIQFLNRYLLLGVIGHTSTGVVFVAHDLEQEKPVAVKYYFHGLLTDSIKAGFARETEILARIKHPGILFQYDHGETEKGDLFRTVDWATGGDLSAWIRQTEEPPWFKRLKILVQVAEGLAKAHDRGIVHGDIKPSNVLLLDKERACLSDWGAAVTESDRRRKSRRTYYGTFEYMAHGPRIGRPPCLSDDIYSFGVTLYQILTGGLPEAIDVGADRCAAGSIVKGSIPPGAQKGNLPKAVKELFSRSIQSNPGDRFNGAAELAATMSRLVRIHTDRLSGIEARES